MIDKLKVQCWGVDGTGQKSPLIQLRNTFGDPANRTILSKQFVVPGKGLYKP